MANNCYYALCIKGDENKAIELQRLLNSGEMGVWSCSDLIRTEAGFEAGGNCGGSFYNSVDIEDADSPFRSAVAKLGLDVEVYGQEPGSDYEEHFVVEGDKLTVSETAMMIDLPLLDADCEEIARRCDASVGAVLKSLDDSNIRIGGYEWDFDFGPAYARKNDPVLQERFMRYLADGSKDSETGMFFVEGADELIEDGFTEAEIREMERFLTDSDCHFQDTAIVSDDPMIICFPLIENDLASFDRELSISEQNGRTLNALSIIDCGESEIDEEVHIAENNAICDAIDSTMRDKGAVYIAEVSGANGLPFVEYSLIDGEEGIDSFIAENADFHSGVDWEVSSYNDVAVGICAVCHGHPNADGTADTRITLHRLTDGIDEKVAEMGDSIEQMAVTEQQALLSSLFGSTITAVGMDQTVEHIEKQIETVREAVYKEQTVGLNDFRELSDKGEPISDEEFARIFDAGDEPSGLDAKAAEAREASEALRGDDGDDPGFDPR